MFLERSVNKSDKTGWIEVICGSMFSGKTEELIRRIRRVKLAKQKVKVFKPKDDTRYSKKKVTSHDANSIKSKSVNNPSKIIKLSENIDVVGIDEAQFFDDTIVDVCNELANSGKRVIVAGLDMDYLGNPFGPMPNLMAIAEYVTKVHAICSETGNIANYSYRKKKEDSIILIGEEDEYKALSRELFFKKMNSKKKKT